MILNIVHTTFLKNKHNYLVIPPQLQSTFNNVLCVIPYLSTTSTQPDIETQVLIDALSEKRTNRTLALGFVWQLPQVGREGQRGRIPRINEGLDHDQGKSWIDMDVWSIFRDLYDLYELFGLVIVDLYARLTSNYGNLNRHYDDYLNKPNSSNIDFARNPAIS